MEFDSPHQFNTAIKEITNMTNELRILGIYKK
jgi:hypothetical protein